jgi:hypothetical protein
MFLLLSLNKFIMSFKFSALLIYLVMTLKFDLSSSISPKSYRTIKSVRKPCHYHLLKKHHCIPSTIVVSLHSLMTSKVWYNAQRTRHGRFHTLVQSHMWKFAFINSVGYDLVRLHYRSLPPEIALPIAYV